MSNRTPTYIILEDVFYTAIDIHEMVKKIRPRFKLLGIVEEISEALRLIREENPNLIIADTTASDGDSIDGFIKASVNIPVIFISEFSEYSERMKGLNVVTLILKPVAGHDLAKAFQYYDKTTQASIKEPLNI